MRDEMTDAMVAWLQGLELVRTRFLGLLATADIYPIEAAGRLFDPRLHLAMETESAPTCRTGPWSTCCARDIANRSVAPLRRGDRESRRRT